MARSNSFASWSAEWPLSTFTLLRQFASGGCNIEIDLAGRDRSGPKVVIIGWAVADL